MPSTIEEVAMLFGERGRSAPRTAVLIRLRLLEGPASAYELYRFIREVHAELGASPPRYENVRQMLYVLKKLNLVTVTGERQPSRPWLIPESLYEIVPGSEDSPLWLNPKAHYRAGGAARRAAAAPRRAERWPSSVEECEGFASGELASLAVRGGLEGLLKLLELREKGCRQAGAAWLEVGKLLEADRGAVERLARELAERGVLGAEVEYDAGFLLWLVETLR